MLDILASYWPIDLEYLGQLGSNILSYFRKWLNYIGHNLSEVLKQIENMFIVVQEKPTCEITSP